ncbi:MAG: DUF3445 domain-containing protein [Gammaproteobacteria bacterium]
MSVEKYYPFNGKRGRLRLGLGPIDVSDWIQYEDDFADRIIEKEKLIKEFGKQVLHSLPNSVAVQKEFLNLLLENIQQYHADRFEVVGDHVFVKSENKRYELIDYESCPLKLASYLSVDDYCLLEQEGEDHKLVAASVCAPTWWNLQEKMGKPLANIHEPVMNLEVKIGRMIRHFLQNLKVTDCYQRSNWFLFASNEYCIFPGSFDFSSEMNGIDQDNIEDRLYLRSERQTFRRLKSTSAIVFGIKVYVEPISIVKNHPAIAEDLLIALNTMDVEQKQGLGVTFVEKPLSDYLNKVLVS